MGIYSDILESVKDNPLYGYDYTDISYCKNICSAAPVSKRTEVKKTIKQRIVDFDSIYMDQEEVEKREKRIADNLQELESIRYRYNLIEKIALQLKSDKEIDNCFIIENILCDLISQSQDMNEYISSIKQELRWEKKNSFVYRIDEIDDNELRFFLVQGIFRCIDNAFKNGLLIEREMFKKLVMSLCTLIDKCGAKDGNISAKMNVEKWFINVCGENKSLIECQNCGHAFLKNIPYCFKCYDGRFSLDD